MSLQLETREIEYEGKRYTLKANMKALEALQDDNGSIGEVYKLIPGEVAERFFRAMLNCARTKLGEPPVDADVIREDYSYAMLHELDIVGMLNRAMFAKPAAAQTQPGDAQAGDNTPGN